MFKKLAPCALICMTLAFSRSQILLAQGCPGSGTQSPGPDVIVGTLGQHPFGEPSVTNFTSSGGIEAYSLETTSCNLGNTALNWMQAPNTNHPVIAQNCYRLKQAGGYNRFEQLGMNWLKHGFFAESENECCTSCAADGSGTHLGVGCSDPYNSQRNSSGSQSILGPRWQVNATTGVHIQPQANPGHTGTLWRFLQVKIPDLEASTGTQPLSTQPRYFSEGQYVSADDAAFGNKNNNASYRPLTVSGSGTAWTFGVTGSTQRQRCGIRAWKDFDPTVTETDVVTPEDAGASALVIISAQATNLGGGVYHYEYAIQNQNSDRSIGSVIIPVSASATVTNIGFHDVDYHDGDGSGNTTTDGTDWPGTFSGGAVTWSYVNVSPADDNALRWGTLYNFRFDCNLPPTTGNITLVQYKTVNNVVASTIIPSVPACACPGDLDASHTVDGNDVAPFTAVYLGTSSFNNCADVAAPTGSPLDDADVSGFVDLLLADTVCP